nr:MAG TPA: hypothetical protein [Caudoviricetes sp.]
MPGSLIREGEKPAASCSRSSTRPKSDKQYRISYLGESN